MVMTDNEIQMAIQSIMTMRPEKKEDKSNPPEKKRLEIKKRWDDYLYQKEIEAIENGEDISPIQLSYSYFSVCHNDKETL